MAKYIHLTKESGFELDPEKGNLISKEYKGLFVYKFSEEFPLEETMSAWGNRTPIIIDCPEHLVVFVQDDPIGDDPHMTEYVIPFEAFAKCRYWQLN